MSWELPKPNFVWHHDVLLPYKHEQVCSDKQAAILEIHKRKKERKEGKKETKAMKKKKPCFTGGHGPSE